MKVLIVHNAYQSRFIGGEDIIVRREINGLKANLGEQNVYEYIVHNDDIKPLKLLKNIWGDQFHFKQIQQLVKNHHIDIVHIHNFFPLLTPSVFKAAKKAGALVIHTLHNFRWWCIAGTLFRQGNAACEKCLTQRFARSGVIHACYRNSRLQSLAAALAFRWYRFKAFQKHIDAYFVLSAFQREKLKGLIASDKLHLKPNAVEMPNTVISYGNKKDYLYVGRLEAAKGIELLLQTWVKLPSHFILSIIGSGEESTRLKKQYQKDNIVFLEQCSQEEVFKAMQKAKYLIHPSLAYETFGLTIVESLARGTPVIGFQKGTRPEFIRTGENGFLCNEDELEQTILRAENHPDYESLSQNAFESAKPFYLQQVMNAQIDLYNQLLMTSRGAQ